MTDLDELLPPHDAQAEQATLGAILASSRALAEVSEVLEPGDFYRPAHQAVYLAALHLDHAGEPVDPVTVADRLNRIGDLARVGGAPYLHTLFAAVPTAANASYYAEIVAEKATLRRLMEAGHRITQQALTGANGAEVASVVENARQTLDAVTSRARAEIAVYDLEDLADAALDRYASPEPPSLPTGWPDLNAIIGGLRPGTLTVIGARPGVGKSVLGINLVTHAAARGHGALFLSLEMPKTEVIDRVIANLASVELDHLTKHRLSPHDWEHVRAAHAKLKGWPLKVVDYGHVSLTTARTIGRDQARSPRGLSLLVVDYLQLMKPADPRAPREQQVAGNSRGLKLLAKELDVPVVALAQVNRGSEQRSDRRPALADLRESGSIEADADAVLLLHHDPEHVGEIEVGIPKNRHGRTGTIHIPWSPHYARAGANPNIRAVA
ncbi:replicative DNA helicase [Actinosynnema sp.]|uniref:replicative DNA helicase n=1 Tax=Actinosynnema sp. TaxID=1872144 RepID=UPI003F836BB6